MQPSKTNPVEEPPLQSDEHRCLSPSSSSSSSCLQSSSLPSSLPLSTSPLFIRVQRVPSSRLQLQPIPSSLSLLLDLLLTAAVGSSFTSFFLSSKHPTIHLQAWRPKAGPFLRLRGRVSRHLAALLASEKGKKNKRRRKRGILFILFITGGILFVCLIFFLTGLQFWLCVGTRKRGPKCLKQITCCRCLGVTLRCVALIYVACPDTTLVPLYLSVLSSCCIMS